MTRNTDLILVDLIDRLTDPPGDGPVRRWGLGVAAATAVIVYSIVWFSRCCDPIQIELPSRYGAAVFVDPSGRLAIAFGAVLLSAGSYLHFRWFWGTTKPLANYCELLQILSLIGVTGSVLWTLWLLVVA